MDVTGCENIDHLKQLLNEWQDVPINVVVKNGNKKIEKKISLVFNQYSEKEIIKFFSKFILSDDDKYIYGIQLEGAKTGSLQKVKYSDIYYIEAIKDKVYSYTATNGYLVDMKLYQLEEKHHSFIRINKSTIVNILKVDQLTPLLNRKLSLTLSDGQELEVSRNYLKDFKNFILY